MKRESNQITLHDMTFARRRGMVISYIITNVPIRYFSSFLFVCIIIFQYER